MILNNIKIILLYTVLLLTANGFAQQPPIPVELFAGNRAFSYQHVINKSVFDDKFTFFNVVVVDAEYNTNKNSVFVIHSLLSYKLGKGFSVGIGTQIHNAGTFVIAGMEYAYISDKLMLIFAPSVNLNGKTYYEQVVIFEYRPKLNEKIRMYSRLQVLTNTNFENYNRGYQQFKFGLERNGLQFRVAATFDQFNSNTVKLENYGIFARKLIF